MSVDKNIPGKVGYEKDIIHCDFGSTHRAFFTIISVIHHWVEESPPSPKKSRYPTKFIVEEHQKPKLLVPYAFQCVSCRAWDYYRGHQPTGTRQAR